MINPMTTDGDMIYQASGIPARLGVGSDGQVLGVVSGVPTWQTAGAGGGASFVPLDDPDTYSNGDADEFPGPTLDAAWTVSTAFSGSNALVVGADPFSRSCAAARFDGSGSGDKFIAHRPYTPPGTAKSITCKLFGEMDTDYNDIEVGFHQSGNDHAVAVLFAHVTNPVVLVRSYTGFLADTGNSDLATVTLPAATGAYGAIYLHLQSDGSGNWSAWYARSGMDPVKITFTSSFALTPDQIVIKFAGYGQTKKKQLAIDWVRPDYATL
jgi:hypothetical protein